MPGEVNICLKKQACYFTHKLLFGQLPNFGMFFWAIFCTVFWKVLKKLFVNIFFWSHVSDINDIIAELPDPGSSQHTRQLLFPWVSQMSKIASPNPHEVFQKQLFPRHRIGYFGEFVDSSWRPFDGEDETLLLNLTAKKNITFTRQ